MFRGLLFFLVACYLLLCCCFSLQHSESDLQEVQKKLEGTVNLLETHLRKAHEDAQIAQENFRQELERERLVHDYGRLTRLL